jgi:predicted HAD superfamily phosphohydrolase YqeG
MSLPRVIESDRVAFFDCDDTLILWKKHDLDLPTVTINGREFQVHTKHLQKIHDYHVMGFTVFVWSNSGHKWAKAVAEALGVSEKVTCMCKPHRVFDDCTNLNDTIGSGYLKLEDK